MAAEAAEAASTAERRRRLAARVSAVKTAAAAQKAAENYKREYREACVRHKAAKERLSWNWKSGRHHDCTEDLDTLLKLTESDVLYRCRSIVRCKQGLYGPALQDATRAVELHESTDNLEVQSHCLHHLNRLPQAGAAKLHSMRLSNVRSPRQNGYNGLLAAVRRERAYYSRPNTLQHVLASRGTQPRPNIFDPDRIFGGNLAGHPPPDPPELSLSDVRATQLHAAWRQPLDGPNLDMTVTQYSLQIARWEVRWLPKEQAFFDGFSEFHRAYEGSGRVFEETLMQLEPATLYKLRARASGYGGPSEWSEAVEVTTAALDPYLAGPEPLPASWLKCDWADLVDAQGDMVRDQMLAAGRPEPTFEQQARAGFFVEVAEALRPHVKMVKKLFKHFAQTGRQTADETGAPTLTVQQFLGFCKEVKLIKSDGRVGSAAKSNGEDDAAVSPHANPITSTFAEAIFQRANLGNMQGRGVDLNAADSAAMAQQALDKLDFDAEDEVLGDGGKGRLVMHEWAGALVRVAWVTYPHAGHPQRASSANKAKASEPNRCGTVRVGERLATFIDETLLRWWRCHTISNADVLDEPRKRPRVLAVLKAHEAQLRVIFRLYANADQKANAKQAKPKPKRKQGKGAEGSINLKELLAMVKEGGLLDEELTVYNVTSIFNFVNSLSEEEGGDDQATELDFEEMMQALVRMCYEKVPPRVRDEQPLELHLVSFLEKGFLPTFSRLIREKKIQGVGTST